MITRIPDNPITRRGDPVNPAGIVVELLEASFIGLSAAILVVQSRKVLQKDYDGRGLRPRFFDISTGRRNLSSLDRSTLFISASLNAFCYAIE